jgi:hypothetical protein
VRSNWSLIHLSITEETTEILQIFRFECPVAYSCMQGRRDIQRFAEDVAVSCWSLERHSIIRAKTMIRSMERDRLSAVEAEIQERSDKFACLDRERQTAEMFQAASSLQSPMRTSVSARREAIRLNTAPGIYWIVALRGVTRGPACLACARS